LVAVTKEVWGSAATLEQFAPNRADDERFEGGAPGRRDLAAAPN
jgi:hypothetical protein